MWHKLSILFLLSALVFFPALSAGASTDEAPLDEVTLIINGNEPELSTPPVIREGRTMVPLRGFFEAIGATVDWCEENRVAQAYLEETDDEPAEETFQPQALEKEEEELSFDASSLIIDGRIYIPLRSAADCLGYEVDWDEESYTASLTQNGEKEGAVKFLSVSADEAEVETEEAEKGTAEGTGSFIWPVEGGGRVTSPYGWRNGRFHAGADIGASTGTPILASDSGTVVFSGWEGAYGRSVIIRHGHYYTRYAHNSANLVSTGQSVEQGQVIAKVGATGRATGPHLHFEIRTGGVHGSTHNPLNYISR